MKKIPILGVIILIFLVSCITPIVSSFEFSSNNVVYVDDDNTEGPWDGSEEYPYRLIQNAVDNASNGYTVFVNSGFYIENVFIDKTIKLVGQEKNTTFIDGGRQYDCIYITSKADGVIISGFTIQHSGNHSGDGFFDQGIDVHSNNNIITKNIIMNHRYNAIGLRCSNHNNISFNIIQNNRRAGIEAEDSRYNQIYHNVFRNNSEWGVMFHIGGINIGNRIIKNSFIDNFKGIAFARQAGNEIIQNNFIKNYGGHARSDFTLFSRSSTYNNIWDANYWDDWNRDIPRRISGFFSFDIDWHPRENPYDVSLQNDDDINYWTIIAGWGANPHQAICVDREIKLLTRVLHLHGWEDNHIKILQNENAKKDEVLESFVWLNDMGADENDVVFIFLSFHGFHKEDQPPFDEPNNMDGFLVPFDFEFEILENGIIDDELGDSLDTLKSKNIVAVIESCHSGEMIDGAQDLCGDGRVILTSCSEEELSYFLYPRLSGLFSYYIIKGLNGQADKNQDGWVSAEELFMFAEQRTIYRSYISSIFLGIEPDSQYPQIYDGWPLEDQNESELLLIQRK